MNIFIINYSENWNDLYLLNNDIQQTKPLWIINRQVLIMNKVHIISTKKQLTNIKQYSMFKMSNSKPYVLLPITR
jgi:hypothetical protein